MKKIQKNFQKLIYDFILCGICGWCMEIIFTSLKSLRRRDFRLTGTTSLWMFPIYGSAILLKPFSAMLRKKPAWLRGLCYAAMIFGGEYLSGSLLSKKELCPWDYGRSRFHIRRVIRLDFTPLWFGAGLLFEKLLTSEDP